MIDFKKVSTILDKLLLLLEAYTLAFSITSLSNFNVSLESIFFQNYTYEFNFLIRINEKNLQKQSSKRRGFNKRSVHKSLINPSDQLSVTLLNLQLQSSPFQLKDILLLTPPFTQLNTPYPATAYLKGFLNTKGISSFQMDLGIEVILELFSRKGLSAMFEQAAQHADEFSENSERIYMLRHRYIGVIDAVILFLQGKNEPLARDICSGSFLPEAGRFEQLEELDWAFGSMGMQDRAKHLATVFLEDLSDFIVACVDPHFGFSRYAERLGRCANSFDELHTELQQPLSLIDQFTIQILSERIKTIQPKLVAVSVPFPGNLFSAFRCAQWLRGNHPEVKIAMGGGFPNTELRDLKDSRVFDYFHYICLDDGELPLEKIWQQTTQNNTDSTLKRTLVLENGVVSYSNSTTEKDYKQQEAGTPDYADLQMDRYLNVIEVANPMHSLWSDGRWLKLTMAHGCYWGKCTFCDVSLDYIKVYEPIAARTLVDRMEAMIAQTGLRGFHFVDEAAPPALMRALAIEIIRRGLTVTWWTNIRFEKSFTRDLCKLLKASGCIAVSGGLEVASDRLLALINKGVTVEQVAQVTAHFTEAGIMVHSYLMYGYPTQTAQETIDSLEMVRQLFELNVIQSGFWHQFALTAHSPIGQDPKPYGVITHPADITFANNDVQYHEQQQTDHGRFSFGLKKSLYNYMHGLGFELPAHSWFDFKVPKTKVPPQYIGQCIDQEIAPVPKSNSRIIWLGASPIAEHTSDHKKGKTRELTQLTFYGLSETYQIRLERNQAEWLCLQLEKSQIGDGTGSTFSNWKSDYENALNQPFEPFFFGKSLEVLKEKELLVV